MKRLVRLLVLAAIGLFLTVSGLAVAAQGGTPPPYAGLKNPFPWDDTAAQAAGKATYGQSCQACHGPGGNLIVKAGFRERMEREPDFYFWAVSEGRLSNGMPPFKSSLSETQRWQALTYLWSLGGPSVPPPAGAPVAGAGGSLLLTSPGQGRAGQPLTLAATLLDTQGAPVAGAAVKFLLKVDFFASGLMEIGEAVTNDRGIAGFTYTPRLSGDLQAVARYETIEAATALTVAEAEQPLYRTEVGLELPAVGKQVFIIPRAPHEPGQSLTAPTRTFRLGGITTWVLSFALVLVLLWSTYFRVVYQVFRIPIVKEMGDTNTRLVPIAGMVWVAFLGILLVLMFVASPFSHLHLAR